MVESDCDLLSLRLGTGLSSPLTVFDSARTSSVEEREGNATRQQQQQQITIFYGGRICVCDVTELQARAIIGMAKLEMDERMKKNSQQVQHVQREPVPSQSPPTSSHETIPHLLNPGLSMKRSLQRFLQKRKTRIDSSPYTFKNRLAS